MVGTEQALRTKAWWPKYTSIQKGSVKAAMAAGWSVANAPRATLHHRTATRALVGRRPGFTQTGSDWRVNPGGDRLLQAL